MQKFVCSVLYPGICILRISLLTKFTHSSIFCFTETNINNEYYKNIEDYQHGWANIHKLTEHGLAICYDTTKVEIVQVFTTDDRLQLLPVLLKIEDDLSFPRFSVPPTRTYWFICR